MSPNNARIIRLHFLFLLGTLWTWQHPASAVHAGNDDSFPVGNQAAIVAGAVAATVSDGSATYYNPAGLGAVTRSGVDVSASGYVLRHYQAARFLQTPDGATKDASVTEFVAVPTQVAYVRRLTPGVSLGLGYYVPRAGDVVLRERVISSEGARSSSAALDLRVSDATYVLGAAVGARVAPTWRLGVGLYAIYENQIESAAIFGATMQDAVSQSATHFGVLGTYTRVATEPRLGVQWDVSPEITLALSAAGPRLQVLRSGEESVSLSVTDLSAAPDRQLMTFSEREPSRGESLGVSALGRYALAMAYHVGSSIVRAELDVQPGYTSARTQVDRRSTWNVRAGWTWRVAESTSVGLGVFSDRGTNRDRGDASGASRTDFYGASAGIELSDILRLLDVERADSLILSTVFAVRYAYGRGFEGGLRLGAGDDLESLVEPVRSTLTVHELNLHVGSALYF